MVQNKNPKSKVECLCEICGNISDRKCNECQLTFYCCSEHQRLDYQSIHEKCCSIIQEIRDPKIGITQDERKKQKQRKFELTQSLLKKCLKQSELFVMKEEYKLAIPSSLQSLKCAKIIFGKNNIRLVPILLTLSRACLGASRIKQSEQFLSMTKLIMHQCKCDDFLLKSQFHRLYGRLHAMSNRFDKALNELSYDVYYSSLTAGPQHIRTAAGYYQMSQVLLKQQKTECALDFYAQIVEIWMNYLIHSQTKQIDIVQELGRNQINEAITMLQTILDARKNYLGSNHMDTGKIYHTFALLSELSTDALNAQSFYKQALSIYQLKLGETHKESLNIQNKLQQIEEQLNK
eukprot:106526_1